MGEAHKTIVDQHGALEKRRRGSYEAKRQGHRADVYLASGHYVQMLHEQTANHRHRPSCRRCL